MSVPLTIALACLVGFPVLIGIRWAAKARHDSRWVLDIGDEQLIVRPCGPLTRARPEDWDTLAAVAGELGVDTIVIDLPGSEPDETAAWAFRRARERIGSVARLTLAG